MKSFFLISVFFISSGCFGQLYLRPNEVVILSFSTDKHKQVYLVKDKSNKYISYRFGTKSKIEFEYPDSKNDSWKKFTYSYYLRGGGPANDGLDLNYVYFTNADFRYVIFDTYFADNKKSEIGIKVTNLKTKKTIIVKGDYKTRKGTLVDFRDNELLERGDELFD